MELDNLRRQWQQQAAQPAASPSLTALLTARDQGPVAHMWRRVWIEAGTAVLAYLGLVTVVLYCQLPPVALLLGVFTLMALALGYCHLRKIQVLRQLRRHDAGLYQHVGQQVASLRQLTRLHYWVSMTTALAMLLIMTYWAALSPLPHTPSRLAWLALQTPVSLIITHFIVRYHLRSYYGRPIEELAASLQELQAAETGR